jgi:hypothetical protein
MTIIAKTTHKPHTVFLNPDALEAVHRQRKDTEY